MIETAEVTGGCFCCRFGDLMRVTQDLIESSAPDVVIVEAVGSCTDLQATVMRPLTEYYGEQFSVAPLTTVVDPLRLRAFRGATESGEPESDLSYLFSRQLAEAEVIAVNKIDLIGETDPAAVLAGLGQDCPGARSVPYSARNCTGLTEQRRSQRHRLRRPAHRHKVACPCRRRVQARLSQTCPPAHQASKPHGGQPTVFAQGAVIRTQPLCARATLGG